MNVYTDPKLLDVAGALDTLPALPLDGAEGGRNAVLATGTDGGYVSPLAPLFASTADNPRPSLSLAGNVDGGDVPDALAVSGSVDKKKDSLTTGVSESACRGDWIRTSDLLNPIQEVWRVNSSENTALSCLAAF